MVQKNLEATGFCSQARVVSASFDSFLHSGRDIFDVAFIDPPYQAGLMAHALELAVERMAPGGVIVCEHGNREELASVPLRQNFSNSLPESGEQWGYRGGSGGRKGVLNAHDRTHENSHMPRQL